MKKILLTALSLVLVAALAIGGTLAYLTDRDAKANVFTVGNVDIVLNDNFAQGSQLIPGAEFEKNVSVTNTGKNDAWVWVDIVVPDALKNVLVLGGVGNGWKVDGNRFSFVEALAAGKTTSSAITKVSFAANVDIDPNGDLYVIENGNATSLGWNINKFPEIVVSAYAIQTNDFASVEAAQAAYAGQWGNNGDAVADSPVVFEWEGLAYVTDGDEAIVSSNGGDTLYRGIFSDGKSAVTSVVVGEGVTKLNNRALCKAPALAEVTLPESLTYIDEGVFQQSGFVTIEVPENVTYIGKTAFGACPDLETIIIKAKDVTFANYVARDCASLKEVYIYSDSVTFESGSMYFTNKQTGDASNITFYVSNQDVADAIYNASSASRSYGMLIKSIDGATTYYNTIK